MAGLVAAVVCEVGVADASEGADEVASHALLPVEVCIGIDAALLREERTNLVLRVTQTCDVEVRHARHGTEGLLVGAVQGVVEQAVQHKALAQLPFGSEGDVEHRVFLDVLVVTLSIFEDGEGVTQRVVAGVDIDVGIGVGTLEHG